MHRYSSSHCCRRWPMQMGNKKQSKTRTTKPEREMKEKRRQVPNFAPSLMHRGGSDRQRVQKGVLDSFGCSSPLAKKPQSQTPQKKGKRGIQQVDDSVNTAIHHSSKRACSPNDPIFSLSAWVCRRNPQLTYPGADSPGATSQCTV